MMLTELQTLQTLVKQLNTHYQENKTELTNLKKRPMVDASEVLSARQTATRLENNFSDLQSKFDELAKEKETLVKQLTEKTNEIHALAKQVETLTADKKELLAKNEISSQRAQTILERLSALDSAGDKAE